MSSSNLLVKEFSTDKDLKMKSERFIQERQSKDRNKASCIYRRL